MQRHKIQNQRCCTCTSSISENPCTHRKNKHWIFTGRNTQPAHRGCQQHKPAYFYPPPCISYANVHNYYGPYAYCSLDKGVACAQHIQLPTYTCAG